MILYQIKDNIYTGHFKEVDTTSSWVAGEWTPTEPPTLNEGEFALYVIPDQWRIVTDYAPPTPTVTVPDQVSMHKVEKAAILTPWEGFANLKEAIEAGINQLPSPSKELAMIEWTRAPNLVRDGLTTQAVMQIIGMTPEQMDQLILFADSMP